MNAKDRNSSANTRPLRPFRLHAQYPVVTQIASSVTGEEKEKRAIDMQGVVHNNHSPRHSTIFRKQIMIRPEVRSHKPVGWRVMERKMRKKVAPVISVGLISLGKGLPSGLKLTSEKEKYASAPMASSNVSRSEAPIHDWTTSEYASITQSGLWGDERTNKKYKRKGLVSDHSSSGVIERIW